MEFPDGVVQLSPAMIYIGQATVGSGIRRLGAQDTLEFAFGCIEVTRGKLLTRATNMRCGAIDRRAGSGRIRRGTRSGDFEPQRSGVQFGTDTRKTKGRIWLCIYVRGLQSVGAERLRGGFALLIGL